MSLVPPCARPEEPTCFCVDLCHGATTATCRHLRRGAGQLLLRVCNAPVAGWLKRC